MQLFIAMILCVAVAADRLENTYLPPSGARAAGGDGNVLNSPVESSDPSGNYEDSHPNRQTGNGGHSGPQNPDANAATLRFHNENNGEGSYNFEFETENKIFQQESGELKDLGNEEGGTTVVRGRYSYMAPDGIVYSVEYIADENGFQPIGEHIPTAPSAPEAIQKSLESNVYNTNEGYSAERVNTQREPSHGRHIEHQIGFAGKSTLNRNNQHTYAANEQEDNQHQEYPSKSVSQTQGYPSTREHINEGLKSGIHINQRTEQNNEEGNHHSPSSESGSNIARGFALQQEKYNNNHAEGNPNHSALNIPRGFTPKHNTHSNKQQETFNQGHAKQQNQHTPEYYPINSGNKHEGGNPNNSVLNIPRGFTSTHDIHNNKQQEHFNEGDARQENQHTPEYYPSNSGTNIPHGFASQQRPTENQERPAQGYPTYINSINQNQHDSPINSQQGNNGYPSNVPSNIPQGFAPHQDHLQSQLEHPASTEVHFDNIDSSHQHDHSSEDDAVVVEAAGRSFQPPQVPRERATPGQQAFNEHTGYQY